VSCLGGDNGADGPGGIALLDHDTFDVLRAWETDRGTSTWPTTPGGT
jgi:selenium-binding protein 1